MINGKPWRVTNIERRSRLDPHGQPYTVLAVSYEVPARNYTHTLELPEPEATTDVVQSRIQADVDRLEALYAL